MRKYFICILLFFGVIFSLKAQEEKYIGLFVYNFTKYFDWPVETKTGDFIIQVLGHETVYDELKRLTADKTVGNQKIVVQHITTPEEINTTNHILFVGHWQTRHIEVINAKLSNKPILLVTEFEGLLQKGSTINFVVREGKIKFELNTTNAKLAGLKTDPRLRELAFNVVE